MPIQLAIVTPEADVLNVSADEVIAPGEMGEIGLLPGHIALISTLRPGVLTVIQDRKKTFFAVSNGFVEIENDRVTVLTDSCEEASTIDVNRARRALLDAEEQLKTIGPDDPGYVEQIRRAARARARIDTVERRG